MLTSRAHFFFFNFIDLILDFITMWLLFMKSLLWLDWVDPTTLMFVPLLSFLVTTSPWLPVTEETSNDLATLKCSVDTYERCRFKVDLLFGDTDEQKNLKKPTYSCCVSLQLPVYDFKYKDRFNTLKCKVKDGEAVQDFVFRSQPSGEKPNEFLVFFLVIRLQVLLWQQDQTQWTSFLSSV